MALFTTILTAITSVAAVIVPILGKMLKTRTAALNSATAAADFAYQGIKILEQAIEQNETLLRETKTGISIVKTIKSYGPVAAAAVDVARDIAHGLQTDAQAAYVRAVMERERDAHAAREAAIRSQGEVFEG